MKTVVLIPCTDRKRILPSSSLCARNLSFGDLNQVAKEWSLRVRAANERFEPDQLYCGRAYKEGRQAADLLGADLAIVSAGHGIVPQGERIPSYGLTVAAGKQDSIPTKVQEAEWSTASWWQAIGEHLRATVRLSEFFELVSADLVLIALSENYANLLASELAQLSDFWVKRIRVFGAGLEPHLPSKVRPCLMPYDVRLNGPESPIRGTMSDFPTRALHHYALGLKGGLLSGHSCAEDRCGVEEILHTWSVPEIPVRKKLSDQEVINFVLENWEKTKGRSGVSLRLLRDSGNACEQGRFKDLFKRAAAGRLKPEVGVE